jgi:hypothetical protein
MPAAVIDVDKPAASYFAPKRRQFRLQLAQAVHGGEENFQVRIFLWEEMISGPAGVVCSFDREEQGGDLGGELSHGLLLKNAPVVGADHGASAARASRIAAARLGDSRPA